MLKPILKYSGGKQKELIRYMKYIPSFNKYYEPFFGGGATFFALAPRQARVGDVNKKLIGFYKDLVENFSRTKKELRQLQDLYESNQLDFKQQIKMADGANVHNSNEDLYYSIRDMFNGKCKSQYAYSTLYYFLNKTAYAGMVRYNKKGEFNVPYGRYVNFNTELLNSKQYELLSRVEIANESYENAFEKATSNDFMFLDPPYDTAFSDYGNEEFIGDFGEDEHRKLAEDFKNLSSPALMIISSTKLTEELYGQYVQGRYNKNYSVNIRNRFKSKAEHMIVANYDIRSL